MNSIHIDINTGEGLVLASYPTLTLHKATCQSTVTATLSTVADKHPQIAKKSLSLSLYMVETAEGRRLNHDYRGKDYATNVLSFPSNLPDELITELDEYPLGELIICLPVVVREAKEQGKTAQAHFTHLLVHGCLHLLGYDHELSDTVTEADAHIMESLEVEILKTLGLANPYEAP